MQFPDNEATRKTEQIMTLVRTKLPDLEVHIYNAVYSSCYEALNKMDGDMIAKFRETMTKAGIPAVKG